MAYFFTNQFYSFLDFANNNHKKFERYIIFPLVLISFFPILFDTILISNAVFHDTITFNTEILSWFGKYHGGFYVSVIEALITNVIFLSILGLWSIKIITNKSTNWIWKPNLPERFVVFYPYFELIVALIFVILLILYFMHGLPPQIYK